MYYHDIGFLAQSGFFFVSFVTGVAAGFFALVLLAKPLSGKVRFLCDIVFCLMCVLLLVCTNIIYQDAALRVYEFLAFLLGLGLVLLVLKKHSDRFAQKVVNFGAKYIRVPLSNFCKNIMNKLKNILKKVHCMLYNFINQRKEKYKRNGGQTKKKKEKKESQQATETAA